MLIALVNNQRTLATPKLKGLCPGCQQPVTAKCGAQRAWHWAHVSNSECDSWWEETEWHRVWKSNFPIDWQEVILCDTRSGEKHIADVRTVHGLVMEFQHSPLDPQERIARETFYKNMVWIIDASHRKNDYKRFMKGIPQFLKTHKTGIFLVDYPDECLPKNWVQSTKPVFFDFKGLEPVNPSDKVRELLWCLLPGRTGRYAVLGAFNRSDIVTEATEHSDLVKVLLKGHIEANNFLLLMRQRTQSPPQMTPPFIHQPRRRRRF
jgi:competence protein CoiA